MVEIWSTQPWVITIEIIILALYTLFAAISLPWFYTRRNQQPLKNRQPIIAFIGGICGAGFGILSSFSTITSGLGGVYVPCIVHVFASGFFLGLQIDTLRSLVLFVVFNITQAQVRQNEEIIEDIKVSRKKSVIQKKKNPPKLKKLGDIAEKNAAESSGISAYTNPIEASEFSSKNKTENEETPKKSNWTLKLSSILSRKQPESDREMADIENAAAIEAKTEELVKTRRAAIFTQKFVLTPMFVHSLMFVLGALHLFSTLLIMLTLDKPLINTRVDECLEGSFSSINAFILTIQVLLYAFFTYKLRVVEDAYIIKQELGYVGKAGLSTIIIWVLGKYVLPLAAPATVSEPIAQFLLFIGNLVLLSLMIAMPLAASYRAEYDINRIIASDSKELPLIELFKVPEAMEAFKKFLEREFSVENLFFFQAVTSFRKAYGPKVLPNLFETERSLRSTKSTRAKHPEKVVKSKKSKSASSFHSVSGSGDEESNTNSALLIAEAQRIYNNFVSTDAELQVNLPSKVSEKLHCGPLGTTFEVAEVMNHDEATENFLKNRIRYDYFDAALKEIYSLMNNDSYKRFQRTEAYEVFAAKYARRNEESRALEDLESRMNR